MTHSYPHIFKLSDYTNAFGSNCINRTIINEQYTADWYTAHKEQNPYTLQQIERCKCCLEICETAPERWQDIFENIIAKNRIALELDMK